MKRRLHLPSVWLLVLPLLVTAQSDDPRELFRAGNVLYQNGDYAAAEEAYRRLVANGFDGGPLWFNLGNVAFKQKKLGEAIYCWEKARQTMAGDRELEENLELANLLIVDRIEIPPDPFPLRMLDGAVHTLTARQESWIILGLFGAANILLGIYFLSAAARIRLAALWLSSLTAALSLVLAASLGWKLYESANRQAGVIVQEKAEIRSGPATENITVVTVHEGIKVRIRGEVSGWYQVTLRTAGPDGWKRRL